MKGAGFETARDKKPDRLTRDPPTMSLQPPSKGPGRRGGPPHYAEDDEVPNEIPNRLPESMIKPTSPTKPKMNV